MKKTNTKVTIIGGGAAGFFTAINIAEKCPNTDITILEKTSKLLSKVKVSGGGRCNVTNGRTEIKDLIPFYPRGEKKLYKPLKNFSTTSMIHWLNRHGVETKVEKDLRVFPASNNSETIVNLFKSLASKHNIKIVTGKNISSIKVNNKIFAACTETEDYTSDILVICTGSNNTFWQQTIAELKLKTVAPVPSLFSFDIDDKRIKNLPGLSVQNGSVKITGTKLEESGPILITHKGISGPATLKLSGIGARILNEKSYKFEIIVNWLGKNYDETLSYLRKIKQDNANATIKNLKIDGIPERLKLSLFEYCELDLQKKVGEIPKKSFNKLVNELCQGQYKVIGKSTHKEEFVTAGGVDLSEIDLNTFECKTIDNLFFGGEVLNIDALTGGFNFQACWAAGWAISEALKNR